MFPRFPERAAKIATDFRSKYFLRLRLNEGAQPKVLSLFTAKGISILKMVYGERNGNEELLIITDETRESSIKAIVQKIGERQLASMESLLRVI